MIEALVVLACGLVFAGGIVERPGWRTEVICLGIPLAIVLGLLVCWLAK